MAVLLIDGNNLAWASHHAARDLSDEAGNLTGCFFTSISSLTRAIKAVAPEGAIVFWDGKKSERRMRIWPEYKANRHKPIKNQEAHDFVHEQVRRQMKELRQEAFPALGLPQVWRSDIEADDLIWCATKLLRRKAIIMSTDSDFLQLVSNRVAIYHPNMLISLQSNKIDPDLCLPRERGKRARHQRGLIITPNNFFAVTEYKTPEQFLDAKVMMGDKTDNIPGVRGIGPANARALLNQYGNIDGVLEARNRIKHNGTKAWKALVGPEGLKVLKRNYDMIALALADYTPEPIVEVLKERVRPHLPTLSQMFQEKGSISMSTRIHGMFSTYEELAVKWNDLRKLLLDIMRR